MDTQNSPEHVAHKMMIFKFLKIFIIVLTVFVGVKTLNTIKEFGVIGRGVVASNVITVQGTGEILATPSIADFTFTLSEEGKTAQEAQDKVSTKSALALSAVKSAGVEDKDVKTVSYDLSPKYEYTQIVCVKYPCPSGKQTIVGYTVTESVEVKVRKIDTASPLLVKLADIGTSNISNVNFVADDQTVLDAQAKDKAIADAKNKAVLLAKQLGVHLGRVVSFSDQSSPAFYTKGYATDMVAPVSVSAPNPTLPIGQNKTVSNVSVTYEIE